MTVTYAQNLLWRWPVQPTDTETAWGGGRGRQDREQETLRKEIERHTSSLPVGTPVSVQLSRTGFV